MAKRNDQAEIQSEETEFVVEQEGDDEMIDASEFETAGDEQEDNGIPAKQDGESNLAYAMRLKALLAEEKAARKSNGKGTAKVSTGVSRPRRIVNQEAVLDAWEAYVTAEDVDGQTVTTLVESLEEAGLLNEKEATTLAMVSGVGGAPATQKEVGMVLNCNTWMVYNYRREALTKLSEAVGSQVAEIADTLAIRLGAPKPERHTQYWAKLTDEEKAARKPAKKSKE